MHFSKSKTRRPGGYKYFSLVNLNNSREIAELTKNDVWSAIVWNDGARLSVNFLYATCAVFDFDSGEWTLTDAHKWFADRGRQHVIGTTKSHQIEKGGRCVDRFRVIVPLETPITDARAYCQNMKRWLKLMPADQAAADAARRWLPFKEIAIAHAGAPLAWKPYKAPPPKPPCPYMAAGIVPRWVQELLDRGAPEGQRNFSVFKIAVNLAERNFSKQEVIQLVAASRITLDEKEAQNAVDSGFRRARK